MKTLDAPVGTTRLGLAHGPGITDLLGRYPDWIDYVELPFEQLRHNPGLGTEIQEQMPILLHCASMSVAGFISPSEETIRSIDAETLRTATPWIGEHLAFVSADGIHEEADRDTMPTNLTYTLCPQLSEESAERVAWNLSALRPRFSAPMILENSPQYFPIPGSTMAMSDFVSLVARQCDVGMLLDLSHLMITAMNTGGEPFRDLERLPLERVVEVHFSGMNRQDGIVWDDHSSPAPAEMFRLLERVVERVRPRAITFEYNWEALPSDVVRSHVDRAREIVEKA